MSFNINGPSYKPMIQESQSMKNNGGGGNTGYFQQGRKKKKGESLNVFGETEDKDEFTHEIKENPPPEKHEKMLSKFIEKTKDAVKKIQHEEPKSNNPFSPLDSDN